MDSTFINDLRRYLRQQKEMHGERLYSDHAKPEGEAGSGWLFPEFSGLTTMDWTAAESLAELNRLICECQKCPLGKTRTKFVFGVGNPNADIVLVGEAPGRDEDLQGEPFVGRAGKLLNEIIAAINFKREEVYICNILKCRPPNNRDPLPTEVEQCEPYLHKQLELIHPKIMLCLGRIAAQTLLRTTETLGSLRSRIHKYQGIPLMVTYHPAALLRNPAFKTATWEDVQKFRKMYDEMKGSEERE